MQARGIGHLLHEPDSVQIARVAGVQPAPIRFLPVPRAMEFGRIWSKLPTGTDQQQPPYRAANDVGILGTLQQCVRAAA
jgi:hypothetical protein